MKKFVSQVWEILTERVRLMDLMWMKFTMDTQVHHDHPLDYSLLFSGVLFSVAFLGIGIELGLSGIYILLVYFVSFFGTMYAFKYDDRFSASTFFLRIAMFMVGWHVGPFVALGLTLLFLLCDYLGIPLPPM